MKDRITALRGQLYIARLAGKYFCRLLTLLILLSAGTTARAQAPNALQNIFPTVDPWADSILAQMTTDEKIGQLFSVSGFSAGKEMNMAELTRLVRDYHVGGVIWFKGTPYKQAQMTNALQQMARFPLLISIDAEWGLAMRLDSTVNFGYQMALGAIADDSAVYKMGRAIAKQCHRLGIHVNFAPVADINNNAANPVINVRSFGENKRLVARKAIAYASGMQDEHVLAVAKHFPGHGNTSVDSHFDLPVLSQNRRALDTLELYPFRQMFAAGLGSVMTGHLHVTAYDTTANRGASLSPQIATRLLRDRMGFRGLIWTDALNMKGVAKYYKPGELELAALQAGNDILLCSGSVPEGIRRIRAALDSGCMSMEFLNLRVRRILQLKRWTGAWNCTPIDLNNLTAELNEPGDLLLKQQLANDAVTIIKNERALLPIRRTDTLRIAQIAFGTGLEQPFQKMLKNYNRHDFFLLPMFNSEADLDKLMDSMRYYNMVIVSLHRLSNKNTRNFGMSASTINFIHRLSARRATVLVSFSSAYAFDTLRGPQALVCAYQDDAGFQQAAAQMIYGALPAHARLSVTAGVGMRAGTGVILKNTIRAPYVQPEEKGINSRLLSKIDAEVARGINAKAMPGCQIVVAYKGDIIFQKSYGYHTYGKADPVQNSDVYDIASITKVVSTTLVAMKLYESGKLNVFHTLGDYLPELEGNDKSRLQIREVLAHQAGFAEYIPFYKRTLNAEGMPDTLIYSKTKRGRFTIPVTQSLYMAANYKDSIYKWMDQSALGKQGVYKYSDLSMLYMQRVIEKITGKPIDVLADSLFYRPMGLATMGYSPRARRFSTPQLPPTEIDNYFRYQTIQGTVHDPGAAMLGGVAGHAGVFSNANDVALLMLMLENGGKYGNRQYLKKETVNYFTSRQFDGNRRGLGWDKPPMDITKGSPASIFSSPATYGHTGFTGTCVWVDPEAELIYVFLSNRTYPSASDNKLATMNIRTNIHDILYQTIGRGR